MVNHISRDSTNDVYLHSQNTETSTIPAGKTTEVFNQAVNSPKETDKTEAKKISAEEISAQIHAQENSATMTEEMRNELLKVPLTEEILDEMATALQYGLPIIGIIQKAPAIINTQLNNGMLPLHFAIHYGKAEDIELLLQSTDLRLKDANGFDAFDHAVQVENHAVAKQIMKMNLQAEWTAVQNSYDTVQAVHKANPALFALLKGHSEEAMPYAYENIKSNALSGGSSHNSLLVGTINNSDYKGFLRAIMADADFLTQDSNTGETLLHLAMKAGQQEIISFFMNLVPGLLAVKDLQGATPLQIAETSNKQDLIDLIHLFDHTHELKKIQAYLEPLNSFETELEVMLETSQKNYSEIKPKLEIMEKNNAELGTELESLKKNKSVIAAKLEILKKSNPDIEDQQKILEKNNADIGTQRKNLEEINTRMNAELKNSKNSNSIWSTFLGFFFPSIEKNKIESEIKLEVLQKNKIHAEAKLEILKKDKIAAEAKLVSMEQKNKAEVEDLEKNKVDIEAQLEVLKTNKTEMEAGLETLKNNHTEIEAELEALQTKKTEIEAGIEVLKTNKTEIDAKLETLKKNNPKIEAQPGILENNVNEYQEAYKAKLETLSDQEKLQLHYVAKHGVMPHPEGSQGHNQFVLDSIINQNLEQLVLFANLGVPLGSTSVPWDKALEDPMSYYGAKFRAIQASNSETLKGLKGWVWNDPAVKTAPGQGKSLLDMAVYYAKEGEGEQKSLEIIAYLMELGLDPMRINDEGESPFSMALLKGNYKAALLMSKDLEANEALWDRIYLLLKEGSQLRDPLAVSSSKSTQAIFAAAFLLTSMYAGNSVLSYINFIPFVFSALSGFVSNGPSSRDKLQAKAVEPIYLPEIVRQAAPFLGKAAILELGVMPQNPIAMLSTTAVGVYSSAVETFRSVKTAANHVAARPLSAAYKVAAEALPLASNAMRFKTILNGMFFSPKAVETVNPVAKPECKEVNKDDYKNMTTVERVSDARLSSKCPEHAKIMLSANWDDKKFADTQKYYVEDLFKKEVLSLHPDKLRNANLSSEIKPNDLFPKFSDAKETLLSPAGLPELRMIAPPDTFSLISTINSIPYKGVVLDTAVKAGIVWGTSTSTFQENVPGAQYLWPAMSTGTMGYMLGKGLYGIGSQVGNGVYEYGKSAYEYGKSFCEGQNVNATNAG